MASDGNDRFDPMRRWRRLKLIEDTINPPWLRQLEAIWNATPPWIRQLEAIGNATPSWLRQLEAIGNATPSWLRQLEAIGNATPSWLRQLEAIRGAVDSIGNWAAVQRELIPVFQRSRELESAVAVLTRSVAPGIASTSVTSALASIQSTALGQSVGSIARMFPSQSMLAVEALAILAGREIDDAKHEQRFACDSPLVGSLIGLRDAIEKSTGEVQLAARLAELADKFALALAALQNAPRQARIDEAKVVGFLGLVLSLVAIYLSDVQLNYAKLAEERALRQELEDTVAEGQSRGRDAQLQDALDRLIKLLEALNTSDRDASVVPDGQARRYCVARSTTLRERQDMSARRLAVLQPGTEIEIVERYRHWARVQVADHIRQGVHDGWIRTRYIFLCEE